MNKIYNKIANSENYINRVSTTKRSAQPYYAADTTSEKDSFGSPAQKHKKLKALIGLGSVCLLVTSVILGRKKFAPKQIKELSSEAQNLAEEISKNTHDISPVKNKEEYNEVLKKLKQIYKRDRNYNGTICDSRSGRDFNTFIFSQDKPCPNELEGLIPYCGQHDISRDINVFLNNEQNGFCEMAKAGSFIYSKDFPKNLLIDIDSEMAKDYIKCLEYSLKELDKTFGKYEGLVYRGGLFNPKGHQYYSTSERYCPVQIQCQRGQRKLQFHIIKTKNGHKINEFQKKYGSTHFAHNEKEILLPKDTNYLDITNSGRYNTEKQEMAKAIYEDLKGEYSMEEILSKIKIWEEM